MELAQEQHRHLLRIPRRPAWDKDMSAELLQQLEKDRFVRLGGCKNRYARIFIPSYPGYSYPRTPDMHTIVPRIFIPSYPGYSYPRIPDIRTIVPRIFTSFHMWRRDLAILQTLDDVVMTPFERNLDFWRQLWRVIERWYVIVEWIMTP